MGTCVCRSRQEEEADGQGERSRRGRDAPSPAATRAPGTASGASGRWDSEEDADGALSKRRELFSSSSSPSSLPPDGSTYH